MATRLDRMANVAAASGKQAAEAGNGVLIDRTHHVTLVEVGWRSGFECRGQVAVSAVEAVAVSVWRKTLFCSSCFVISVCFVMGNTACSFVFADGKYRLFFCFC